MDTRKQQQKSVCLCVCVCVHCYCAQSAILAVPQCMHTTGTKHANGPSCDLRTRWMLNWLLQITIVFHHYHFAKLMKNLKVSCGFKFVPNRIGIEPTKKERKKERECMSEWMSEWMSEHNLWANLVSRINTTIVLLGTAGAATQVIYNAWPRNHRHSIFGTRASTSWD